MNFNNKIKIIAKPNSPKTEIIGFDKEREAYRVNVKAPADKNKANKEIIRFFSKLKKKKVRIVVGSKSRKKILSFE